MNTAVTGKGTLHIDWSCTVSWYSITVQYHGTVQRQIKKCAEVLCRIILVVSSAMQHHILGFP
jgi:hypothetical protein